MTKAEQLNQRSMRSKIEQSRKEKKSESLHWWDRQHSLVLRQTPRWAQGFVLGLTTLGVGAVIAGYTIKIDEVITVRGKLTPGKGSVEVKTPAGGLIEKVLVKDGDTVKTGDLLMQFDTRRAQKKIDLYQNQIKELGVTKGSTIDQYNTEIKTLEAVYETENFILKEMIPLASQGAASRNMLLKQKNQVLDIQSKIEQLESRKIAFISEQQRRSNELKTELELTKISNQYEVVKAPIAGIIFQQKARQDGVLNSGDVIMKIIPQDTLEAKVRVTNSDIGFIKIGQKTKLRVDAFDYTRFGTLSGKVASIGADAIEPDNENPAYTFPVTIKLVKSTLEVKDILIPMKSGYAITANLRLKEKRLITIVSDLLTNQYDSLQTIRQ